MILEKSGKEITTLGADCAVIEEIFLARNRIQHAGDIGTNWVYQDETYAKKYPKGEFVHPAWGEAVGLPAPLDITAEKIGKAIAEVRKLCAALEGRALGTQ